MHMEICRQPRRARGTAGSGRSRGHRQLSMITRLLWTSPGAFGAPSGSGGAPFPIDGPGAGCERGHRWTAGRPCRLSIPPHSRPARPPVEMLNDSLTVPRPSRAGGRWKSGVKALLGFIPGFTSLPVSGANRDRHRWKTPGRAGPVSGLSPSSPVLPSASNLSIHFLRRIGRVRRGAGLSGTRPPGRTGLR